MKSIILSLVLSLPMAAWAQEASFETVVEDVIFNTSSRVVIDEKTIRDSRAPNVTSLISTQANITITNTPFQPNSVFIRGGDSSHVLILVDGVPFYDASTIQRTFNLNALDIRTIRRIEILKGSQTVLYGGQALSGVIKIETIPQEFKTQTAVLLQGGTQNTREFSLAQGVALTENQLLLARGGGAWRDAKSPVRNSSKAYPRQNSSADIAYAWQGPVSGFVKGLILQENNESAVTAGPGTLADVDGFKAYNQQLGASSVVSFNDIFAAPKLTLGAQNGVRVFGQPFTPTFPPGSQSADQRYGSNVRSARLDLTPVKTEPFVVTAGMSYLYEDFVYREFLVEEQNHSAEQKGLYVKADWRAHENMELSVGGRTEAWETKSPVNTFQAGLTLFQNTKLEVSSGYKFPSLFQLYSDYGNPDLKEEKAIQYSVTQDIGFDERQKLSVTAFYSRFEDLIVFIGTGPNTGAYLNVNEAESKGVELVYNIRLNEQSAFFATYGYQEPKDVTNNRWLLRRPLVTGSMKYTRYWDKHTGTLEVQGAGERTDSGPGGLRSLPGYMIGNASYSYAFTDSTSAFARVNNILDHRYQETSGYYTEGIAGYIGAEFWF